MKKKGMYLFLIFFVIVGFLIAYMYLNPSVDNKDFELEYKISSGKKKFDSDRNTNYLDKDYTFNYLTFYNKRDGKKMIIHSLDKENNGKERVVFVLKDEKEKYPSAIIDYLSDSKKFSLFEIEYKNDSIFLWNKQSLIHKNKELFFKGEKWNGN